MEKVRTIKTALTLPVQAPRNSCNWYIVQSISLQSVRLYDRY